MISESIRLAGAQHYGLVQRRIAEIGQGAIAASMDVSPSTLSEWKNNHMERACLVIAAAGLKLVPTTDRAYPDEYVRALKVLAARGLEAEPGGQ